MKKKTKNIIAAGTATILMLALAGTLAAHHSLAEFDTTTAVRVKGVIVLFDRVNPHSILFVDEERGNGHIQRWAVDGPGALNLMRMGVDKDALKAGDVVEVCGYVTKPGIESQRTVSMEPIHFLGLKNISGRRLTGEILVTSDGEKRTWLDYGAHKCLGPEYQDLHTK
jgi:Family of unknown function (DUF6152)